MNIFEISANIKKPTKYLSSFYVAITGSFKRFQYFETNFLKTKNLFQKTGIQFFSTRIEITTFPHFHTDSAKLCGLRGLVGRVSRVGARVRG